MTDRIDTRDAYGDAIELLVGAPLALELGSTMKAGIVVGIKTSATILPSFTEAGAVEVASFLGRAVSPAACRDLLAELAPHACSDDLPEAVKAFLVGEAQAPHLKRITAEGVAKGSIVRSLIELGRALGRAEEREKVAGLVGAAREVEASRIAMHSADTEDELRDAMAARSRAMGAISAELARLEGGA